MGSRNPYDETQEWLPEQRGIAGASYSDPTYYAPWQQQTQVNYPYYTGNIAGAQTILQGNLGQQQTRQNKRADRMPKAQAVAMARTIKRSIAVASIAVFGVLSGLVATHLQTTATSQSTSASASQNTSSSSISSSTSSPTSSNASPNQNSSNTADSGGFFNQQGGGYGFGNGGPSQAPVSHSRVS